MLNIKDKTKCSGCGACFNICPKNAINMQADGEGFAYPIINDDLCIKCGLCLHVCPIINNKPANKVASVYAAKNKDINVLRASSSGGMFSALAAYVLGLGGVVFGAAFDGSWQLKHNYADSPEGLGLLRRSKYIQSDIGQSYKQAKDFLAAGRAVLFCGTPCQIAGLKNFLGQDYPQLFTMDIICHSVPSPAVWALFLKQNFDIGDIAKIDFRDKTYGWDKSLLKVYDKRGQSVPKLPFYFSVLPLKYKMVLLRNYYCLSYSKGFGAGLTCRPSCHACSFKGSQKYSDFTAADLWGFADIKPDMYDVNGLSIIMLNSPKAQAAFDVLKKDIVFAPVPFDKVVKHNPAFNKSVAAHPKRTQFFAGYQNTKLNIIIDELLDIKPLYIKLPHYILSRLKQLIGK